MEPTNQAPQTTQTANSSGQPVAKSLRVLALEQPDNIKRIVHVVGLPFDLAESRLDNLIGYDDERKEIANAVRTGQSIFLHGRPGRGKSHAAAGAMWFWLRRNLPLVEPLQPGVTQNSPAVDFAQARLPIWTRFSKVLREIQSTYKAESSASTDGVVARYAKAPFVVFDDLGTEKGSDWALQVMNEIVEERSGFMRPTVYTSNFDLVEIGDKIDHRIRSRCGRCCRVELKGTDYRLNGRREPSKLMQELLEDERRAVAESIKPKFRMLGEKKWTLDENGTFVEKPSDY